MYRKTQLPTSFNSNNQKDLTSGVGINEKAMAIRDTQNPEKAAKRWPNFQAAPKIYRKGMKSVITDISIVI